MKRLVQLATLFCLLLLWAVQSHTAFADSPQQKGGGDDAPLSITTFTITPNPALVGANVTVKVNMSINTTDTITRFCLYYPNALTVTLPDPITLLASQGFTTQNVSFSKDTTSCPDRSTLGQTGQMYTTASALLGKATYDGEFTVTINSGSAGTYDWTLLLEEPVGTPNPLIYSHEVLAPTIVYVSDDSSCYGLGTSGVSCFTSLSDAFAVSSATTVRIVGSPSLNADFTWNTQNPTLLEGWGTSPTLNVTGCTTAALDVQKSGVTVRNFTLNGPGGTCTGIAVSGTTISGMTISGFATGISTSGTGDVTIKGNTVTGNDMGISLNNSGARNVYANRVTGNTTTQMACNGGTGAAFNWLGGGEPPTFGQSNTSGCTDYAKQLGADFVDWTEGTALGGLTVSGASGTVVIFDLGTSEPFNVGTVAGLDNRTSNFYAVKATNGTVSITGGGFVYRLNTGSCTSTTDTNCWETGNTTGAEQFTHFVKGYTDPTAVTLEVFSGAAATETGRPVGVLVGAMALAAAGVVALVARRRR
ncbi:MAG: hypothetical protein D6802_00560 [Ardenticatenia bacterium]|nr:MAG: hypothetical protein D6802_00560 [Ardenticatenia bacterium]